MPSRFKMVHRVEFADTDMAGIIHFSSFFRYMEVTEHAFFRSLGVSINSKVGEQAFGWPRVRVECEFKRPVRFEDELEVELIVREKRERLLRYDFVFRQVDRELDGDVAAGSFTVVCVTTDNPDGKMRAVSIPDEIASQITVDP